MALKFKHFRLRLDEDNICWLTIDRAGKSVNTFDREVFEEFAQVIEQIPQESIGVIIESGKKVGFIAGADIGQFVKIEDKDEIYELIREAQQILDKFEALPIPKVAMINGFCLGGGYELALSCDYRVALDDPRVKIGLPEVLLGIHPGWGGSVRLPRLIGVVGAMKIMLPGMSVVPKKAKRLGMIDDVARSDHLLRRAARYFVMHKPNKRQPVWWDKIVTWPPLRPFIAGQLTKQLQKKKVQREHYPAPYALIDAWQRDAAEGDAAMVGEAKSFAEVFVTPTARELIRVFFLQDSMKALGKGTEHGIKRVHVIGAGVMGGDIAAWAAFCGYDVTLQDREIKFIAPAIKRAHKLFKKKLKEHRLIEAAMDRLRPDVQGTGVAKADLVIEAIFENFEVKQQLYKAIEPQMKEGAILATNTSTLPLEKLCTVLKNPERFVGLHFFNPVAKMQLVEVVRGEKTAEDVFKRMLAFTTKIKRLPLPVTSSPGFFVNRALMPYLIEAAMLYDEGVAPAAIDDAAVKFGMPMGPLELLDTVGLDVAASAAQVLADAFNIEVPTNLAKLVEEGKLGKKSGEGIYQYNNGKPVKVGLYQQDQANVPSDLTDRLIMRMLNECVACWREQVVEERDMLDAGMIFGTGFAPFRGGPMRYIETTGAEQCVDTLNKLADKHGDRFTADKGWSKLTTKKKAKAKAKADA